MAAIKIDIKAIELLKAYQGCTTPAQKQALCDSLVQCTADLALEPLWKKCRMQAGLMKFERENRRCVYPDGRPIPLLAWRVEGEAEHTAHKVLVDEAKRLYSREVTKLGLTHER